MQLKEDRFVYIRGLQPFEFEGQFTSFIQSCGAAVIVDYKIFMDILNIIIGAWAACQPHSPTLTSLHLHHSSFSNPSAALPTSQLILQTFCFFTYIIGTSPMSQLILQLFCRFIYATAHSTTLPPLHLHHRSF